MVFQLDKDIWFPDPTQGEPDGLFAVGGDLSVERLLLAYSHGIFPWYSFRDSKEILWYCPMQRFVIFPREIHVSHSMRTLINHEKYYATTNEDFPAVIQQCSSLRYNEPGAWLGKDIIRAYTRLHEKGFARSIEIWNRQHQLVGGLYGVTIRGVFCGESMFSLEPSASKLALIVLALSMGGSDNTLIDCQFETPHLRSMGGRFISYDQYMEILSKSNS